MSQTTEFNSTNNQARNERPVRAGVFKDVNTTQAAVSDLLAASFTKEEITVVCSDENKERLFRDYQHQDPAGAHTTEAAAASSAIGATIGAATTTAVAIAIGGLPVLILGAAGLITGGIFGGFFGAMLTRGVEKEAANFYHQSVTQGRLLVAVEIHGEAPQARLQTAEQILAAHGAETAPLPEG